MLHEKVLTPWNLDAERVEEELEERRGSPIVKEGGGGVMGSSSSVGEVLLWEWAGEEC